MADLYTLAEERPARRGTRVPILAIIAVLFSAFVVYQVAATIQESQGALEERALAPGDRIEYDLVARFQDGRLWDTTLLEVAQRANRTHGYAIQPPSAYLARTATLDPENPGLGYGRALEERVLAAYEGQTVRATVAPEEGLGDWAPLFPGQEGVPRHFDPQPFHRIVFLQEEEAALAEGNIGTRNFNLDQLEAAIGPLHDGFVFNANQVFPPSWDIIFEDVNRENRSVLLRHTVEDGQYLDIRGLPGGMTVLLDDENNQLTYRLDLEDGAVFAIPRGSPLVERGFTPGSYRVASQTEETIQLEYHPSVDPQAIGRSLEVEIRIIRKIS